MWDVFISFATEDRVELAMPLATALSDRGLKVWFDEFELKPGDSIREAIDRGLAHSRLGIVVLSRAFFEKQWTQLELGALLNIKVSRGNRVVPIWHGINHEFLIDKSPMLADLKAIRSDDGIPRIAEAIISLLYAKNDPSVSGILLIDEKGSPSNLDVVLIDEMLLAYHEGIAPPFKVDIDKLALFNGISISKLMTISEDAMLVYDAITGSADFFRIHSDLDRLKAHGAIDRKLSVEFRKVAPEITKFQAKIELGIRVMLTREALRVWLRSRDEEVECIRSYVRRCFSHQSVTSLTGSKFDLRMTSKPYWNFGIYLSDDQVAALNEATSLQSRIIFLLPGWTAEELPHDVIVREFIPRLLFEGFVLKKLDDPGLLPDALFDLNRWSLGLG
jgi:TIR domain